MRWRDAVLRLLFAVALLVASPGAAAPATAFDAAIDAAKVAMLVDPHMAIVKAENAADIARAAPDRDQGKRLAMAEWLQAEAYLRLNEATRAGPLAATALGRIGNDGATKLKGDLLMTRGGYDSATGAVGQAMNDYHAAHNIFQSVGDDRSRAIALINIAILYHESSDWTSALKYYGQAKEASSADPALTYSIVSNLSQTLKETGRYKEAAAQTRIALDLARRLNSPALAIQMLRNLARIELLMGHLAVADRALDEGFRLTRGLPRDDDYASLVNTAAQAALQHGDITRAVQLVGESFKGVDLAHTTLAFRARHETAYDIYTRAGDSENALRHLAAMKRLDDEATKLATSASAALMGARFDFANQETRIAKMRAHDAQRELAFAQASAASQRVIFLGTIGATTVIIVLLAVGLIAVRRSRNQTRDANTVLGQTNLALGKALDARTEFLATTSHEIRTPLNGILGMTQVMLAETDLDSKTRDRVSLVHGAGMTMRALVDDILDVAKMEANNLVIEMAQVDLRDILSDVTRLIGEQTTAKGLEFDVQLSDCPTTVLADGTRLRQIVFNLLSNALKFTAEGKLTLAAAADQNGETFTVEITDSGIGIAADKLDEIFEPFRQADTSTTREFGGTGLGLAICRNLARAMGGDVAVESEPGRGSCFTLRLPLIAAEAPDDATTMSGVFVVVERNPITRSMLKALVEPFAEHVVAAASIDDALSMLGKNMAVQVLADDATLMASGDLVDGVRRLKQRARAVMLLCASASAERRHELVAAGAGRLIAKPISRSALAAELSNNLDYKLQHLVSQAA